jgi:hypothetical protein
MFKMTDSPTFEGFSEPTENWFKFPIQLINCLPDFDKKQIVLLTYLLRHTWGYQDDDPKKITIDEFMNGRKKRDGTRIDRGTGLAKTSIVDGLDMLEKAGFITVEIDDSDKARIEKWYAPRMSKIPTSDVQNLDIGGTKNGHRTEKDNIDRKKVIHPMQSKNESGRKPYHDLVLRYSFNGNPQSQADWKANNGRVGKVIAMLQTLYDDTGGFSPDELESAYTRWNRDNPRLTIPNDPTKVYNNLAPYLRSLVTKRNTVPPPPVAKKAPDMTPRVGTQRLTGLAPLLRKDTSNGN